MEPEDIIIELKKLSIQNEITTCELMEILKEYAGIISVYDLMLASAHMRKDGEFIHVNYREKYLEIYIKHFLMRMKEVLENDTYNKKTIDKETFDESFPMLERTFESEKISDDGIHRNYFITVVIL